MFPPFLIAAAVAANGGFDAPATRGNTAQENINGNGMTGNYQVLSDGQFNWTGDTGGTNSNDTWWSPLNTVVGTWHARLEYVSGNAFFTQGAYDPKDTWIDVSTEIRWNFYKNTWGTGGGSGQGVYNIKWSDDAGSTTYHTCTCTITMSESSL